MRAIVLNEFHATPTVEEIDVPDPGEGEVRVRVRAAAVNGFDLGEVHGFFTGYFEHRFPLVLGKDFAGTVDAVGPGVDGYAAGDRVFGVVTKDYLGDGSFAEYVTVPTSVGVAPLPDAVDSDRGGPHARAARPARSEPVRRPDVGDDPARLLAHGHADGPGRLRRGHARQARRGPRR